MDGVDEVKIHLVSPARTEYDEPGKGSVFSVKFPSTNNVVKTGLRASLATQCSRSWQVYLLHLSLPPVDIPQVPKPGHLSERSLNMRLVVQNLRKYASL